jgi:hypothetical protein
MACPQYTVNISPTEKIGNSLVKINNNFFNLNQGLCDIKKKLDETVTVRTFFYYGPNSATNPVSNMEDGTTSYPKNTTIEQFINGSTPNNLNIPSLSKENDQAYVVYQKTGIYLLTSRRLSTVAFPVRIISRYETRTATFETPNLQAIHSPLFVIWKLIAKKNNTGSLIYQVEPGFPKFSQAETLSTNNWNNPTLWSEF